MSGVRSDVVGKVHTGLIAVFKELSQQVYSREKLLLYRKKYSINISRQFKSWYKVEMSVKDIQ